MISIKIGRAEALVLFEMLADFQNQSTLPIAGPPERLALLRLCGALESTLVEPFAPGYRKLLEEARSRLAAQHG
jgi:hypothetical protein